MKENNRFLSRTRDREKWKKKLSGQSTNEAKADSIYFRPTLSDERRLRDLSELMGETKNSIVEKLVAGALNSRQLIGKKFDEQRSSLRHLEDRTEIIAGGQIEILTILDEMRRRNLVQERFISSILSEIYCMVHTSVSLIRTALLQLLGLSSLEMSNKDIPNDVFTSFEETSALSISRSLEDLEAVTHHHEIKNEKVRSENLYWKSKLKKAITESNKDQ